MPGKSRRRLSASGNLRGGSGGGDSDHCHLPSGRAAVSGGVPADCLRVRLLPQIAPPVRNGGVKLREEASYEHRSLEIPENAAGHFAEAL